MISAQATILYNELENHNFKITATSSSGQWVKVTSLEAGNGDWQTGFIQ